MGPYLLESGNFSEALTYLNRALDIDKAVFGDNHPKVALRLNNIGGCLLNQGEYAKAMVEAERALIIDQANFGEEHPFVALDRNNIGGIWEANGDFTNALKYREQALEILKKVYKPSNPKIRKLDAKIKTLKEKFDVKDSKKGT